MKYKHITPLYHSLFILVAIIGGVMISSCNAKDDEPTENDYVTTESVAVTAFSLSPDVRVMKNLDSVYFSIDLEHGVIFNADSLPKGTNVTKLIPKISYPSTVTSAVIEMKGGSHREGTVNYYSNAGDTIDFTGEVTLTLGASKGTINKTYTLKVNVHKEDPDTIYWDKMGVIDLPSRFKNPVNQKSVAYGEGILSLIEEADGSFTLSSTKNIFDGNWDKTQFEPGFSPVVETLVAAPDQTLYILDTQGSLYSSSDTQSWTLIDNGWNSVIGMYGDILLGLSGQEGHMVMKSWPSGSFDELQMPSEFPSNGFTSPIEFSTKWASQPVIVIFGGIPFNSSGKSSSWAFDGSDWVDIAETALPALSGMSIVKYYSYLNNASNGLLREFEVHLAFGGQTPSGQLNNTIYVSYDNGINWQKAQNYMQLPENIITGYKADIISIGSSMQSNLSNRWKLSPKRRIPYEIDGDIIKWTCPYLFMFGGFEENGTLISLIRSGVFQRLTFVPLF